MANQVAIAERFRTYIHRVPYVWGGASPRGWDCSGAVNYVTCHDMGYAIPGYSGGRFNGSVHGPNTTLWLQWSGVREISRAQCTHGTFIIWPSHMGIAVGPDYYVSAYDTQLGTLIEPIHGGGPIGETARFFNLRQGGGGSPGGGGVEGGGGPVVLPNSGPRQKYQRALNHWGLLQHLVGPGAQTAWQRIYNEGQAARNIGK